MEQLIKARTWFLLLNKKATLAATFPYPRSVDCLIYEMLFIKEKKPGLNTQSDSIRAKLLLFFFILSL